MKTCKEQEADLRPPRPINKKMIRDMINPSYYQTSVRPVEVAEDWQLAFSLGEAVKILARHQHKASWLDLERARWYLEREISYPANWRKPSHLFGRAHTPEAVATAWDSPPNIARALKEIYEYARQKGHGRLPVAIECVTLEIRRYQ